MAEKRKQYEMNNEFHVCDQCRREFKYKKNLIRHIRETHVDRQYFPCVYEHCSKEFKRKDYLKCHLIKVHKLNGVIAEEMMRGDTEKSKYASQEEDVRIVNSKRQRYAPDIEDVSSDELEEIDRQDIVNVLKDLEQEQDVELLEEENGLDSSKVGTYSDRDMGSDRGGKEANSDSATECYSVDESVNSDTDSEVDIETKNDENVDKEICIDEDQNDQETEAESTIDDIGVIEEDSESAFEFQQVPDREMDVLYNHFYNDTNSDRNGDVSDDDDDIIILDNVWPDVRTLETLVEVWTRTGTRFTTYQNRQPIARSAYYEDEFYSYIKQQ